MSSQYLKVIDCCSFSLRMLKCAAPFPYVKNFNFVYVTFCWYFCFPLDYQSFCQLCFISSFESFAKWQKDNNNINQQCSTHCCRVKSAQLGWQKTYTKKKKKKDCKEAMFVCVFAFCSQDNILINNSKLVNKIYDCVTSKNFFQTKNKKNTHKHVNKHSSLRTFP